MWDIDTPALATMLRGLLYTEIALRGPSHDLHSGLYGGAVPNPLNVLTRILGQLHDAEGRVQVPGFYDDVAELGAEEKRQQAALPFDEAGFLASAGIGTPTGEAGRSTLERIWTRPTCDINGIWGGYTGPGTKTVIPARGARQGQLPAGAGPGPRAHPRGPCAPSSRRARRPTAAPRSTIHGAARRRCASRPIRPSCRRRAAR